MKAVFRWAGSTCHCPFTCICAAPSLPLAPHAYSLRAFQHSTRPKCIGDKPGARSVRPLRVTLWSPSVAARTRYNVDPPGSLTIEPPVGHNHGAGLRLRFPKRLVTVKLTSEIPALGFESGRPADFCDSRQPMSKPPVDLNKNPAIEPREPLPHASKEPKP